MQFTVYGAVLAIALGSVLLGTRLGIGPHVADGGHQGGIECRTAARAAETEHDDCNRAGCANHSDHSGRTGAASTEYFCAGEPAGAVGSPGEFGAPIIAPGLNPSVSASSGTAAQAATEAPAAAPEPPANCNVNACTAAYRSFRAADCTYQPSDGPRRLCSK